ncbi:hypothetical protein LOTGIDRAFT_112727 [Lottia gigantea]|uniref:Helicase ATP-binding domain-containing protein n=1 Tax=Lottia gigantea TaxID=225164 RepID=V4CDK5_LOTGI|nr:hypothetical protein LOTGIDRAFT_112727 [Lottia gigantea]ESO99999.1 hypothetical protein LOTGIDRAFT_112727 [Lottia gigantea]
MLDDYLSDDDNDGGKPKEDDLEEEHITKIYFCSRTHSQLSQFVREVIKSPYGDDTRVISLGSRQNLCVNEAVKKLKSLSLINETCLDMQKKGKKSTGQDGPSNKRSRLTTCPYHKYDVLQDFKDALLLEVRDIEQLVTVGKQMKACPYYGTRYAIPAAEIVALPYNTLLHKSTREACGIKLKDNIVIIDEAHNLLETINNIYSVEVTGVQALRAHNQLSQYEKKYRSRLKAKNLMYVKQILFVLSAIVKCLGETQLKTINDFLFITQLDNLNLFKVLRYCERSQISRKLHGFVEKYSDTEINTSKLYSQIFFKILTFLFLEKPAVVPMREFTDMSSPLMHIESFLQALTNADKDGRIVISKQGLLSQSSIKFLLLNPAVHFTSVVQEARSVIVAGGTMQPISEFTDQLFHSAGVSPSRVMTYSCGHVIPGDHILPLTVSTGPSGYEMDFTFQSRESPALLDELGRILVNISNIVPGGIVCFFPSYDYESLVFNHWQKTGLIDRISKKKKVLREPRKSGGVEHILSQYSTVIKRCKSFGTTQPQTGAILLCVVGGKMSEGINFSDDLGRCVVMVGLPYPNLKSPELKEKMDYLNANYVNSEGRQPGQIHYENLCMKAVNQSIGRAIRHRGDYATILLVDRRYNRNNVVSKLPNWISQHLLKLEKFGLALGAVSKV